MEHVLDALCHHFDEELERQETVLAVCQSQGMAARAHDVTYLEAKTGALNLLLTDFVSAEQERLRLVQKLVDHYELPEECQTLSGLVEVVPEPWKRRILDFQKRMREVLAETQRVVRSNNSSMRRSLQVANEAIEALVQSIPAAGPSYDASGVGPAAVGVEPALMDQRG